MSNFVFIRFNIKNGGKKMNDINYIGFTSKNGEPWDKLKQENFKKDKTFTTFRGYGPKKDKYYENNINNIFIVSLDRRQIGKAQLLKKEYIWSDEIPLETIQKDTFKNFTKEQWADQMEEFYGNKKIFGYLLTFKILDVDFNGQK